MALVPANLEKHGADARSPIVVRGPSAKSPYPVRRASDAHGNPDCPPSPPTMEEGTLANMAR